MNIEEIIGERKFTITATGAELSMLLSVLGTRTEADARCSGTDYELENEVYGDIQAALDE